MMSGVNGVHSLLAFLLQQVQLPKTGQVSTADHRQLQLLLQESRQLNETLLKIEKQLNGRPADGVSKTVQHVIATQPAEGHWPAASGVRDMINSQERQQAFGQWDIDTASDVEAEPFRHQAEYTLPQTAPAYGQQLLINRYEPTEEDVTMAQVSSSLATSRHNLHGDYGVDNDDTQSDANDVFSRFILMSVGIALIMLMLLTSL